MKGFPLPQWCKMKIKELLSAIKDENYSTSHREAFDLLQKVVKKIGDKYKMSILCFATRSDTDKCIVSGINMNDAAAANLLDDLLTDERFRGARRLIPDKSWRKASKKYSPVQRWFYALVGAAGLAFVAGILPKIIRFIGGL